METNSDNKSEFCKHPPFPPPVKAIGQILRKGSEKIALKVLCKYDLEDGNVEPSAEHRKKR